MQDAAKLLYQHAPHNTPVSICNAQADIGLNDLNIRCLVQEDRALSLALQQMQCHVDKGLEGQHNHILLLPHKQVQQSCGWMAQAMLSLEIGGTLSVCCANRMGAKSYEKRLKQLAGELVSCSSKKKCRLFSVKRTSDFDVELAQEWLASASLQWVENLNLYSSAGIFSWDKADQGSTLLLEHLPAHLSGVGMDVGCGNGFLSAAILKKHAGITDMHLLDVFWPALQAAQKNVQAKAGLKVHFHHLDATQEIFPVQPHWIVLNPPFHSGQQQDMALGQQMIIKCCTALRKGGHLYMVANRHLAYEAVLKEHATSFSELICAKGFKVLRAEI